MRLFIALTLPDPVKLSLGRLQEKLKESRADVKWVAVKNIHLTLKFLGEVPEDRIENISAAIQGVSAGVPAYQMRLSTVGAFPSVSSPRVIWAGIAEGGAQTEAISTQLETRLEAVGFPPEERPFTAHITLGRRRSSRNSGPLTQALKELQQRSAPPQEAFEINKVTLFKSTLSPQGPSYEALKEYILTAS